MWLATPWKTLYITRPLFKKKKKKLWGWGGDNKEIQIVTVGEKIEYVTVGEKIEYV